MKLYRALLRVFPLIFWGCVCAPLLPLAYWMGRTDHAHTDHATVCEARPVTIRHHRVSR